MVLLVGTAKIFLIIFFNLEGLFVIYNLFNIIKTLLLDIFPVKIYSMSKGIRIASDCISLEIANIS